MSKAEVERLERELEELRTLREQANALIAHREARIKKLRTELANNPAEKSRIVTEIRILEELNKQEKVIVAQCNRNEGPLERELRKARQEK